MENADRVDFMARVALMFLDGDDFERVLIDQCLHTDYRFDEFNRLKAVMTKVARLEPELNISLILWRLYPTNPYVAEPLVAGDTLPDTGWRRVPSNEEQRKAFLTGEKQTRLHRESGISHYYPLRNSDEETVGILEILERNGKPKDVDTSEMFTETLVFDDEEDD